MGSTGGNRPSACAALILGQQAFDERLEHVLGHPMQAGIVGRRLLAHEAVELPGTSRCAPEQRPVLRSQALERGQVGFLRRAFIPFPPNALERVFGHRLPEQALAGKVVGDPGSGRHRCAERAQPQQLLLRPRRAGSGVRDPKSRSGCALTRDPAKSGISRASLALRIALGILYDRKGYGPRVGHHGDDPS